MNFTDRLLAIMALFTYTSSIYTLTHPREGWFYHDAFFCLFSLFFLLSQFNKLKS